jgi:hypothetical protein
MPPAIVMVGFGRQRRIPLPLPVFLLWPFAFLAWYVLTVARLAFSDDAGLSRKFHVASTILHSYANLSGLRIDVHSQDGGGIYLRMI